MPLRGSRHRRPPEGRIVLAALRDAVDPETGERYYTVKRHLPEREDARRRRLARHAAVTLQPINPDFAPPVLAAADAERFRVVAEFVEVVHPPAPRSGSLPR